MKKVILTLTLISLSFILLGCNNSSNASIVGVYYTKENYNKMILDFENNGTAVMGIYDGNAMYSFQQTAEEEFTYEVNKSHLEMEVADSSSKFSIKFLEADVEVSEDRLILKDLSINGTNEGTLIFERLDMTYDEAIKKYF